MDYIAHQAPLFVGFPKARTLGVGCHSRLQEIFPIQGSNPTPLHWQTDSLALSPQGSPVSCLEQPSCGQLPLGAWRVLAATCQSELKKVQTVGQEREQPGPIHLNREGRLQEGKASLGTHPHLKG